jgi:hypothetical protein
MMPPPRYAPVQPSLAEPNTRLLVCRHVAIRMMEGCSEDAPSELCEGPTSISRAISRRPRCDPHDLHDAPRIHDDQIKFRWEEFQHHCSPSPSLMSGFKGHGFHNTLSQSTRRWHRLIVRPERRDVSLNFLVVLVSLRGGPRLKSQSKF